MHKDKLPVSKIPKGWHIPNLHPRVRQARTAVSLATDSLEHTYKTVLQVPSCLKEVELAAAEIDGGHHSLDDLYIALCAAETAIRAVIVFCESRLGRTPYPVPFEDPLAPAPEPNDDENEPTSGGAPVRRPHACWFSPISPPPDEDELRHMLGLDNVATAGKPRPRSETYFALEFRREAGE